MWFSYPVATFMDNTIAASRGLGKTSVPTVIVLLGSCLFRILWVYTIFAWFGTIQSLFLLYIFSWTITALAEIIYFVREYRKI
jgi:Na+-driven multidrug efflux pump